MDILCAVVSDMKSKENFVETYYDDELYMKTREKRISENSDLKFESIFESYKDAVREAKRISKPSYARGWSYNEKRNRNVCLL